MSEINLRKEMLKWLSKRGHWVVIRSSVSTIYLRDNDKESGQPYKIGQGTMNGLPYVDYLVKGFRSKEVPDYNLDTDIGDLKTGAQYFYFEYYLPVKEGDLILEIELDTAGEPVTPVKVRAGYKVVEPEDMRDGAALTPGRVEFYQCRVERMNTR